MPTSSNPDHTGDRRPHRRRPAIPPPWCCSFGLDPYTSPSKPLSSSSSRPPSLSATSRRILSPGRVSPIDSDPIVDSSPIANPYEKRLSSVAESRDGGSFRDRSGGFIRVRLKEQQGHVLILSDKDFELICENSDLFRGLVGVNLNKGWEVELDGVDSFDGFKLTVVMMQASDEIRWLARVGVSRAIEILKVSFSIMFHRGIIACLNYLESAPWTESEEQKLKSLLISCPFDQTLTQEILFRIHPQLGPTPFFDPTLDLIRSITRSTNPKSRKELRSLVNGIISTGSIGGLNLNRDGIYEICHSSLNSLVELLREESPRVESISIQVENLNWLLEILIEKQSAEEFVDFWTDQTELITLHGMVSPMVRYELSRVSATVFMAFGRGTLHCNGERRLGFFRSWFGPMLVDFSWLRRSSKGLDLRMLEESMGRALLTLTLNQQQGFFMEWFRVFSDRGRECPNLTRAFQVWWRRSFVRTFVPTSS